MILKVSLRFFYQKILSKERILNLPENADIGKAINDAMKAIAFDEVEMLRGVAKRLYQF